MKKFNFDQKFRLVLWPILTFLFINTFGTLAYVLSGIDESLENNSTMVVSPTLIFKIILLLVAFVFAFFIYDQQRKRMAAEFTLAGEYNMRGRGVKGFVVHTLIGLVEAAFAFFTLNTFWMITNYSLGEVSQGMKEIYWLGFGFTFVVAAYFLTRQMGLAFLAYGKKG